MFIILYIMYFLLLLKLKQVKETGQNISNALFLVNLRKAYSLLRLSILNPRSINHSCISATVIV